MNLIDELDKNKFKLEIDLQKFNNDCYEINCLLSDFNYFLRVFELKNKFRQMIIKEPKKTNFVRQLSSCIIEKYNGYQTISTEFEKKQRKNFKPIDIIYKPTKNPEKSPVCYFTPDISKAYQNLYSSGDKIKSQYCPYCYCNKFVAREERQKRHTENCSGVPGVIYNFNTKSLISFQDNFNSKGNLPFVLYFDFETTAPADNIFDPEQKNVCCILCFNCCFPSGAKFE